MPKYATGQTEIVAARSMDPVNTPLILIIDDDAGIRGLLSVILRREGFDYHVAADGEDAQKKLRRYDYDAILLDLMLPKLNGFEVLRFLKAERRAMLQRVIVVTAVAEITLRDFDDQKLVWSLLRKPFELHELLETVAACAENARAQRLKEASLYRRPAECLGS